MNNLKNVMVALAVAMLATVAAPPAAAAEADCQAETGLTMENVGGNFVAANVLDPIDNTIDRWLIDTPASGDYLIQAPAGFSVSVWKVVSGTCTQQDASGEFTADGTSDYYLRVAPGLAPAGPYEVSLIKQ